MLRSLRLGVDPPAELLAVEIPKRLAVWSKGLFVQPQGELSRRLRQPRELDRVLGSGARLHGELRLGV